MQDLGTLGGLDSEANAINRAGQIVGEGYLNGTVEAYLFDPGLDSTNSTPEPSTMALLAGAGIFCLLRKIYALRRDTGC